LPNIKPVFLQGWTAHCFINCIDAFGRSPLATGQFLTAKLRRKYLAGDNEKCHSQSHCENPDKSPHSPEICPEDLFPVGKAVGIWGIFNYLLRTLLNDQRLGVVIPSKTNHEAVFHNS
jgi:hypothetical protein